jgi:hypothetical protein
VTLHEDVDLDDLGTAVLSAWTTEKVAGHPHPYRILHVDAHGLITEAGNESDFWLSQARPRSFPTTPTDVRLNRVLAMGDKVYPIRVITDARTPAGRAGHGGDRGDGGDDGKGTPSRGRDGGGDAAPADATPEREINVWFKERPEGFGDPLVKNERVTLRLNVGQPRLDRVYRGEDSKIGEIPADGLATEWSLASAQLELLPDPAGDVTVSLDDGTWLARFPLTIPQHGASDVREVAVVPRMANASLSVTIHSGGIVYRTFRVEVPVGDDVRNTPRSLPRIDDHVAARLGELKKAGGYPNWAPRHPNLSITVVDERLALVSVQSGSEEGVFRSAWSGATGIFESDIDATLLAADTLRENHSDYFDAIDGDDLQRRVANWQPERPWTELSATDEDDAHRQNWSAVAQSKEVRDLAFYGHKLYNAVFKDARLRERVDAMAPGQLLRVIWNDHAVMHMPWNLMYRTPPPASGPVDPLQFLGLRLRIHYDSHADDSFRTELGAPDDAYRGFALYWDGGEIGTEAQWQKRRWEHRERCIFRPEKLDAPKQDVVSWFSSPEPTPIPFLYLYCETTTDPKGRISLRFGNGNQTLIGESELGTEAFPDRPLVFANACGTAGGTARQANRFAKLFFDRKCRAYIGTECRVPVVLASRFAHVFVDFFERRHDGRPAPAGEALAQARIFLWTQYRNLGGLFYCIINQYHLVLAAREELEVEAS